MYLESLGELGGLWVGGWRGRLDRGFPLVFGRCQLAFLCMKERARIVSVESTGFGIL